MFKGFGKPKKPSIEEMVDSGLFLYSGFCELLKDEPEGIQLLSQCVMRYTHGKKDSDIQFARILVGHALKGLLLKAHKEEENQITLYDCLQTVLHAPMEEIKMIGV